MNPLSFLPRAAIACAVLTLTALPLAAQQTIQLSEQEAVERAVSENLSLRSQRTSLSATQRRTETAWNVLLPSVSAQGSLSRSSEARGGGPTPPGQPTVDEYYTTGSASLDARWTLVASVLDEIESARHSLAASELSYEQAKQQTAQQVRNLYYTILLAQERIAVRETAVETAQQNLDQVQASFDEGRVDTRTVRQAELRLQQARQQRQRSQGQLDDAVANFKGLLGIAPDRDLELTGSLQFESVGDNELPDLAAGARPNVARLASQLESQEASLAAAKKNRWMPTLSLSASYTPSLESAQGQSYNGFPDPFTADNPPETEWADSSNISVSLSFNFTRMLPFSQEAVAVQTAEKQAAALRLDRQAAVENAQREYESLVRSVENARAAVESQQLNVSLNEEVLQLTQEQYDAGQTDFISLQEAQVSVAEARLALLNEVYNLRTSLIELEYASGQPSIE